MNDFHFSCPFCGQPFDCDGSLDGTMVKCPTCEREIMLNREEPIPEPVKIPEKEVIKSSSWNRIPKIVRTYRKWIALVGILLVIGLWVGIRGIIKHYNSEREYLAVVENSLKYAKTNLTNRRISFPEEMRDNFKDYKFSHQDKIEKLTEFFKKNEILYKRLKDAGDTERCVNLAELQDEVKNIIRRDNEQLIFLNTCQHVVSLISSETWDESEQASIVALAALYSTLTKSEKKEFWDWCGSSSSYKEKNFDFSETFYPRLNMAYKRGMMDRVKKNKYFHVEEWEDVLLFVYDSKEELKSSYAKALQVLGGKISTSDHDRDSR